MIAMKITFDPSKRLTNIKEHEGLDLADAGEVFQNIVATETRQVSAGYLRGRMVVMVWTKRGEARHIISMRYCHGKEEQGWLNARKR